MLDYHPEYLRIAVFLIVSGGAGILALALPFLLRKSAGRRLYTDSYECGVSLPETKDGIRFNINFYLLAISFIVFDVEIALLMPWALQLKKLSLLALWSGMLFVSVLVIGFIYELVKGGLEL